MFEFLARAGAQPVHKVVIRAERRKLSGTAAAYFRRFVKCFNHNFL